MSYMHACANTRMTTCSRSHTQPCSTFMYACKKVCMPDRMHTCLRRSYYVTLFAQILKFQMVAQSIQQFSPRPDYDDGCKSDPPSLLRVALSVQPFLRALGRRPGARELLPHHLAEPNRIEEPVSQPRKLFLLSKLDGPPSIFSLAEDIQKHISKNLCV